MIKTYRPILVFYVIDRTLIEDQIPDIKSYAVKNGYDFLIWDKASNERLEIISVDKETTVTDIQKWIDNELKTNGQT